MTYNIYADNAATTRVCDEALAAMLPFFSEQYGNASGNYKIAMTNRKAIDQARETIANGIGATDRRHIYFTGSGTEADNWAIKGVAFANREKGNHIITTAIEHHAVLHPCDDLVRNHGFQVTYLPVDETGRVPIEALTAAIRPETILISVMFANNETGVIQPIRVIGAIAKAHQIIFHTDAVQALGHVPIDVVKDNIDLLSVSAHKVYGPKGVGALYIGERVNIRPLIHGGAQERHRRAGTENVAGIVGFGVAAELATKALESENGRLKKLTDMLIDGILENVPFAKLNGDRVHRMPHIANFSFQFIEGEGLLMFLDNCGIVAASGSACTSGTFEPSHVLLAMGGDEAASHGSLRVSLGRYNTEEEVTQVIEAVTKIVGQLRSMSPAYEAYLHDKK